MGQKINPNIIRLGRFKEWNSKFFELNKEEHTTLNYQNLQIVLFLKKFFKNHKIDTHDIKLGYSNKILYIYISYYYTRDFFFLIKKTSTFKLKKKKIKKRKPNEVPNKITYNKINRYLSKRQVKKKLINKLKKHERLKLTSRYRRLKIISTFKNYGIKNRNFNKDLLKKNNFINKLLETLTIFTKKKYHIKLIFQHVNKGMTVMLTKPEKKELRKKTLLLKQYSRTPFFTEGMSTIITMLYLRKPVNSFLNFLSM